MDFSLKDHDIEIAEGDFALCATDRDAIAQDITMRLKTIAGEWFMDTNVGIPYLTDIFGQKKSERFLRQMITPSIDAVPGVKQIKDFNIHVDDHRKVTIRFTAVFNDQTKIAFNESIGI